MEKSKRKLANTMLYYVIILCIAAIITVTLFTASKKEVPPKTDDTVEASVDTAESAVTSSENRTEPAQTSSVTEGIVTEAPSDTKAPDTAKTDAPTQPMTHKSPVNGYVSKEYSIDVPVYSLTMNDYRAHTGVDLVCSEGSPVAATSAGVIKSVSNHPMMGTTVIIEHADGITTYYMNLNETLPDDIKTGAKVNQGQLLGAVGTSAMTEIAQEPHLHFEMTVSGAYVDPMSILDMSSVSVMSDNVIE